MRRLFGIFALAVCVWVVFKFSGEQLSHAYALGDQLTDIADPYSEANGIRAGEAFATLGFTSNSGLPEVSFGTQFDRVGGKYDIGLCPGGPVHCVYLHYPPGSEYIIAASTKLFGKGHLFRFRFVPILFGVAAYSYLAFALFRTLGAVKAGLVMWSLTFAPMADNMMHGLELHSYTMHLIVVETALLFRVFFEPSGLTSARMIGLAVTNFVLGWFSFDCVFIGALLPITFWFMTPDRLHRKAVKTVGICLLLCGGALVLAYVLHFIQVANFLGSYGAAFNNYRQSAVYRTSGPTWVHPPVPGALGMIIYYWFDLLPQKQYFGFQFFAFVTTVVFALTRYTWFQFNVPALDVRGAWKPEKGYLSAFLWTLLIASLWVIVMQQHSSIHGHFLPRNYFVVFIMGVALVLKSINVNDAEPEPTTLISPS